MDGVRVVCVVSRFMMQTFGARVVEDLKDYKLFKLLLPAFRSFIVLDIQKEVEKNRLVISNAAAAHRVGRSPDDVDTRRLLEQAREIDCRFLREVAVFPIAINIRYREIEPIRRERIERLIAAVYRLFVQWDLTSRFRPAIAALYDRNQFADLLRGILGLYALETKLLSASVDMPWVFTGARDSLADTVYAVMERVADQLAGELTDYVFRGKRRIAG